MRARGIDLNADLGEGYPHDDELLGQVTSASVACGFHAGDPVTMVATARRAAERGVVVGAHPSYADREGFGRRALEVDAEELLAGVVYQIGAMAAAASAAGTALRFVKPHGALYNRAAADPEVAEVVVRAVASLGLPLLCPAGSRMEVAARSEGVAVYSEAFADRAYGVDGRLVSRDVPGAVIDDPAEAGRRALGIAVAGRVTAIDGTDIEVPADSICVHGDAPGAQDVARAVRRALLEGGVEVRPFIRV